MSITPRTHHIRQGHYEWCGYKITSQRYPGVGYIWKVTKPDGQLLHNDAADREHWYSRGAAVTAVGAHAELWLTKGDMLLRECKDRLDAEKAENERLRALITNIAVHAKAALSPEPELTVPEGTELAS